MSCPEPGGAVPVRLDTSHGEIGYQYDAYGGVHIGTKTVGKDWCYMN